MHTSRASRVVLTRGWGKFIKKGDWISRGMAMSSDWCGCHRARTQCPNRFSITHPDDAADLTRREGKFGKKRGKATDGGVRVHPSRGSDSQGRRCNCPERHGGAGSPACGRVPRPDAVTGRNRSGRLRRSGASNGVSRGQTGCSYTRASPPAEGPENTSKGVTCGCSVPEQSRDFRERFPGAVPNKTAPASRGSDGHPRLRSVPKLHTSVTPCRRSGEHIEGRNSASRYGSRGPRVQPSRDFRERALTPQTAVFRLERGATSGPSEPEQIHRTYQPRGGIASSPRQRGDRIDGWACHDMPTVSP
jgi:hypothetical protein